MLKNGEKVKAVAEEAARIMRDYPHLKYYEAITRAKEVLKDDIRKQCRSDNPRTSGVDA